MIKVKGQNLPHVNLVNIILYDDNGDLIKFDVESSTKSKSKLEQE